MKLPVYAAEWALTLVEDQADVETFLAWVDGIDGMISIDTETRGLDWTQHAFTRLVQFADDERSWAVPTAWWGRPLMQALATILDKGNPVCFWNAGFDMHALEADGFPVPHWHQAVDGYILHHLLVPHARHGLKGTAAEELGRWATAGEAKLRHEMGQHGWTWETVPVDHPAYWQYGCVDTLITQRVVRILEERVEAAGMAEASDREHQALAIMYRAEVRGMRIDHRYAEQVRREWLARSVTLRDQLQAQGISNPNSNRQVEAILRDAGWKPEDFTETGQAVLDKLVLNALSASHPEIAEPLVEYKRLTKWIGAYLDPFANSGGRVHPGIHTLRAKTGRMSITKPALQTLPSKATTNITAAAAGPPSPPRPRARSWTNTATYPTA